MLAAAQADRLLAVGSTLQVYPVAGVVPAAKQAGARVVIINNQPTPMTWESKCRICCLPRVEHAVMMAKLRT